MMSFTLTWTLTGSVKGREWGAFVHNICFPQELRPLSFGHKCITLGIWTFCHLWSSNQERWLLYFSCFSIKTIVSQASFHERKFCEDSSLFFWATDWNTITKIQVRRRVGTLPDSADQSIASTLMKAKWYTDSALILIVLDLFSGALGQT